MVPLNDRRSRASPRPRHRRDSRQLHHRRDSVRRHGHDGTAAGAGPGTAVVSAVLPPPPARRPGPPQRPDVDGGRPRPPEPGRAPPRPGRRLCPPQGPAHWLAQGQFTARYAPSAPLARRPPLPARTASGRLRDRLAVPAPGHRDQRPGRVRVPDHAQDVQSARAATARTVTFFANATPAVLPRRLAAGVLGVVGLTAPSASGRRPAPATRARARRARRQAGLPAAVSVPEADHRDRPDQRLRRTPATAPRRAATACPRPRTTPSTGRPAPGRGPRAWASPSACSSCRPTRPATSRPTPPSSSARPTTRRSPTSTWTAARCTRRARSATTARRSSTAMPGTARSTPTSRPSWPSRRTSPACSCTTRPTMTPGRPRWTSTRGSPATTQLTRSAPAGKSARTSRRRASCGPRT